MDKQTIKNVLNDIGLSNAETAVYLALLTGADSAAEIVRTSGEKRPTVYYALNLLEKRGLVSKNGREYGSTFQLEPVEKLTEVVKESIRDQEQLLSATEVIAKTYEGRDQVRKSVVSYFDSIESVKTAIFYTLYSKEKKILSIVPGKNFFHQMGQSFVKEYVLEKKKRQVETVALWEDIPSQKVMRDYYKKAAVRQLPVSMHNSFATTIFIYDDKTLYVSPKADQHAVLIQSNSHADMMRATFAGLWENALEI